MFCEILENYSSFFIRKRVKIKLLKFLSCINCSCLGYCILGVVGSLLKESRKKKKGVVGARMGYYPFSSAGSQYRKLHHDTGHLGARQGTRNGRATAPQHGARHDQLLCDTADLRARASGSVRAWPSHGVCRDTNFVLWQKGSDKVLQHVTLCMRHDALCARHGPQCVRHGL